MYADYLHVCVHVTGCNRVQICVYLTKPGAFNFRGMSGAKGLCYSHTSHATWTLLHCLLWAGWPGPTLPPALSNTRCRSPSAAGPGGCGVFLHTTVCVCMHLHGRDRVVIVVDEFIIKDMAPSTLSPLLSHCIVTNRLHEAWQPGRPDRGNSHWSLSVALSLFFFFSYVPFLVHEKIIN